MGTVGKLLWPNILRPIAVTGTQSPAGSLRVSSPPDEVVVGLQRYSDLVGLFSKEGLRRYGPCAQSLWRLRTAGEEAAALASQILPVPWRRKPNPVDPSPAGLFVDHQGTTALWRHRSAAAITDNSLSFAAPRKGHGRTSLAIPKALEKYRPVLEFKKRTEADLKLALALLEKLPTGRLLLEGIRKHKLKITIREDDQAFTIRTPESFLNRNTLPAERVELDQSFDFISSLGHELGHALPLEDLPEALRGVCFLPTGDPTLSPQQNYANSVDNTFIEEGIAGGIEVLLAKEIRELGITWPMADPIVEMEKAFDRGGIDALIAGEKQVGANHRILYNARGMFELAQFLLSNPALMQQTGIEIQLNADGQWNLAGVRPEELLQFTKNLLPEVIDRIFGKVRMILPIPSIPPPSAILSGNPASIRGEAHKTELRISLLARYHDFLSAFIRFEPVIYRSAKGTGVFEYVRNLYFEEEPTQVIATLLDAAELRPGPEALPLLQAVGERVNVLLSRRGEKKGASIFFVKRYAKTLRAMGYEKEGNQVFDAYWDWAEFGSRLQVISDYLDLGDLKRAKDFLVRFTRQTENPRFFKDTDNRFEFSASFSGTRELLIKVKSLSPRDRRPFTALFKRITDAAAEYLRLETPSPFSSDFETVFRLYEELGFREEALRFLTKIPGGEINLKVRLDLLDEFLKWASPDEIKTYLVEIERQPFRMSPGEKRENGLKKARQVRIQTLLLSPHPELVAEGKTLLFKGVEKTKTIFVDPSSPPLLDILLETIGGDRLWAFVSSPKSLNALSPKTLLTIAKNQSLFPRNPPLFLAVIREYFLRSNHEKYAYEERIKRETASEYNLRTLLERGEEEKNPWIKKLSFWEEIHPLALFYMEKAPAEEILSLVEGISVKAPYVGDYKTIGDRFDYQAEAAAAFQKRGLNREAEKMFGRFFAQCEGVICQRQGEVSSGSMVEAAALFLKNKMEIEGKKMLGFTLQKIELESNAKTCKEWGDIAHHSGLSHEIREEFFLKLISETLPALVLSKRKFLTPEEKNINIHATGELFDFLNKILLVEKHYLKAEKAYLEKLAELADGIRYAPGQKGNVWRLEALSKVYGILLKTHPELFDAANIEELTAVSDKPSYPRALRILFPELRQKEKNGKKGGLYPLEDLRRGEYDRDEVAQRLTEELSQPEGRLPSEEILTALTIVLEDDIRLAEKEGKLSPDWMREHPLFKPLADKVVSAIIQGTGVEEAIFKIVIGAEDAVIARAKSFFYWEMLLSPTLPLDKKRELVPLLKLAGELSPYAAFEINRLRENKREQLAYLQLARLWKEFGGAFPHDYLVSSLFQEEAVGDQFWSALSRFRADKKEWKGDFLNPLDLTLLAGLYMTEGGPIDWEALAIEQGHGAVIRAQFKSLKKLLEAIRLQFRREGWQKEGKFFTDYIVNVAKQPFKKSHFF